MSRYIDADAFLKEYCEPYPHVYMAMSKAMADAPTIDIVRCKECKHNYNKVLNHGKMQPRCDFTDWKLTENDFCSRGEREGE